MYKELIFCSNWTNNTTGKGETTTAGNMFLGVLDWNDYSKKTITKDFLLRVQIMHPRRYNNLCKCVFIF